MPRIKFTQGWNSAQGAQRSEGLFPSENVTVCFMKQLGSTLNKLDFDMKEKRGM